MITMFLRRLFVPRRATLADDGWPGHRIQAAPGSWWEAVTSGKR